MRRITLVPALALLALAGCGEDIEHATRAPFDHVKTGLAAKDHAKGMAAMIPSTHEVQSFQVKHGRNPASIEELEASEGRLRAPPPGKRWSYDPATGALSLVDE